MKLLVHVGTETKVFAHVPIYQALPWEALPGSQGSQEGRGTLSLSPSPVVNGEALAGGTCRLCSLLWRRWLGPSGACAWNVHRRGRLHSKWGASAVNPAALGWGSMWESSLKSIFSFCFQMGICNIQRRPFTVLFAALSYAPNSALGCLFSVSGNLKKGVMHKTSS